MAPSSQRRLKWLLPWIVLLFLGTVWGLSFSLARIATVAGGTPFGITFWQSVVGGAILLVAADILVRLIPTTSELKLGVVTAFLGVPIFLLHLLRERRTW